MPKLPGTRNYTVDEQYRLLTIVSAQLPQQQSQWDAVTETYNTSQEGRGKPRSRGSLKRKFLSLCLAARNSHNNNGGSIEKLAADLKRRISEYTKRIIQVHHRAGSLRNTTHSEQWFGPSQQQSYRSGPDSSERAASWNQQTFVEAALNQEYGVPNRSKTSYRKGDGTDLPYTISRRFTATSDDQNHMCAGIAKLALWFKQRDQQQQTAWQEAAKRERKEREHWQSQCVIERKEAIERYTELLRRLTTAPPS